MASWRESRGLVIAAYLACGGLGIGSLGPWGTDFFGHNGIGNNGSLTLLAAGLAAFAVWRWTTSLRRAAAISALTLGALSVALAVHDVLDIREIFSSSDDLGWIDGVGWGLILALLSGTVLVFLSISLYRRSRVSDHPNLNWKQRALLMGIGAVFLIGLSSVALAEPERSDVESLVLEGPGRPSNASNANRAILALRPGSPAESVANRLGPPVAVIAFRDEATFYYDSWQLTFTRDGLRDRVRYLPDAPELSLRAYDGRQEVRNRKIRNFRPGASIGAVKAMLGQPEAIEVYRSSLRRDVGLWYGEWRLDFNGGTFQGAHR